MRNAEVLGVFSQADFFKKASFIFFLIAPLLISLPSVLAVQNASETDLPNTLNNFDDAFESLRNAGWRAGKEHIPEAACH